MDAVRNLSSDLLTPDRWAPVGPLRRAQARRPGAPLWSVLERASVLDPERHRIDSTALEEFVDLLREAVERNSASTLGDAGGGALDAATAALRLSLLKSWSGRPQPKEVVAFIETLDNPKCSMRDLLHGVRQLALATAGHPTLSLILFRDTDHEGKLYASYLDDAAHWEMVLRPRSDVPDRHIALIPHPTSRDLVDRIAADLGASEEVPCVVFVGTPDATRNPGWPTRHGLATLPFARTPGYVEQLTAHYRSVYAKDAFLPGTPMAAAIERFGRPFLSPTAFGSLLAGLLGREWATATHVLNWLAERAAGVAE